MDIACSRAINSALIASRQIIRCGTALTHITHPTNPPRIVITSGFDIILCWRQKQSNELPVDTIGSDLGYYHDIPPLRTLNIGVLTHAPTGM
jgi:hypothetical protein